MSEPIKVGDLVQVVRARLCCGNAMHIGKIFTVTEFIPGVSCQDCGTRIGVAVIVDNTARGCEIERLKRIPPLSELEGRKTEETLKLPRKETA